MSDNIKQFSGFSAQSRGKRILLFSLLAVIILLVLVPIVLWNPLNFDALARAVRYGDRRQSVGLDSDTNAEYAVLGDSLFAVSSGAAELRPLSGADGVSYAALFSNPTICTAGKYALAYDCGNQSLCYVGKSQSAIDAIPIDGELYDADITSSGLFCTATSESGYKTVLRVYDTSENEVFRWFSSSQFLPLCALSKNGNTLAAISYTAESGKFQSQLLLFRTDSDRVDQTIPLSDSLVLDLRFLGNQTLCILTQTAVLMYQSDGKLRGSYEYGDELTDYSLASDDFVLLSLPSYDASGGVKLVSVDENGKELGNYVTDAPCRSISSNGYYASALTDNGLTVFTKKLRVYSVLAAKTAHRALVCKDGSAIIISDRKAEHLLPQ